MQLLLQSKVYWGWSSVLIGLTGILFSFSTEARSGAKPSPCNGRDKKILVLTGSRELFLCEGAKALHRYAVSLGTGGTGKTAEGDEKTPLGEYRLGTPRPSPSFGTFIPVAYPTLDQRRQGYNGGQIGIHGPTRATKFLGKLNTIPNWTQGCIAVGTDEEINAISQWVKLHHIDTVFIR